MTYFFFLLINTRSCPLVEIRWSICISKSRKILGVALSIIISHQRHLMVLHKSVSESKSYQVPRTFLLVLHDLNNAVVWIVPILLLITSSSSLFSKPLRTIPSAPTTTGIIITFMFHGKIQVLVHFFVFFHFHSLIRRNSKILKITCLFVFSLVSWLEFCGISKPVGYLMSYPVCTYILYDLKANSL